MDSTGSGHGNSGDESHLSEAWRPNAHLGGHGLFAGRLFRTTWYWISYAMLSFGNDTLTSAFGTPDRACPWYYACDIGRDRVYRSLPHPSIAVMEKKAR
jgi:hypothetical protein